MSKRQVAWMVTVVLIAAVASTGCVSKKMYRQNVEETDQRIAGVESGVETNEKRIEEVSSETDGKIAQAQGTAEMAVEIGEAAAITAASAKETADEALIGRLLWTVVLSEQNVKFSFDGAGLSDEGKAVLDELAARVMGYGKGLYLEIRGHTDNIGSEEYNYVLGARRAQVVRRYLNETGEIPLHAMNVISMGETEPIADNSTPEGRSQNRRVVIDVLE